MCTRGSGAAADCGHALFPPPPTPQVLESKDEAVKGALYEEAGLL
jgi:hypothetical protein